MQIKIFDIFIILKVIKIKNCFYFIKYTSIILQLIDYNYNITTTLYFNIISILKLEIIVLTIN